MTPLPQWIQKNAWAIAITMIGVVISFAMYGYRLDVVEAKVESLQNDSLKNQILLAEIKKDIEYIRIEVTKLNR